MGILPAPTIANLYVAIYKLNHSIPLLEKYLVFYKRFINNGFAIWLHNLHPTTNTNNWNDFKALLNTMGLRWTFKSPRKKLIFMDMTFKSKERGLLLLSMPSPWLLGCAFCRNSAEFRWNLAKRHRPERNVTGTGTRMRYNTILDIPVYSSWYLSMRFLQVKNARKYSK